jgi:invasion protein IalB
MMHHGENQWRLQIMNKSFAILASVLLGAAAFGVTAVSAQTKPSATKCGPEGFSGKDMNYASVPCNSGEQASAQPCKPEGFSGKDMSYNNVPCSPGTTYENPGWKGAKVPK